MDYPFFRILLKTPFAQSYKFNELAYSGLMQKKNKNLAEVKEIGYLAVFELLSEEDRVALARQLVKFLFK